MENETPEQLLERIEVGLYWCQLALQKYRACGDVEPGSAQDVHVRLTGHRLAAGCCVDRGQQGD